MNADYSTGRDRANLCRLEKRMYQVKPHVSQKIAFLEVFFPFRQDWTTLLPLNAWIAVLLISLHSFPLAGYLASFCYKFAFLTIEHPIAHADRKSRRSTMLIKQPLH